MLGTDDHAVGFGDQFVGQFFVIKRICIADRVGVVKCHDRNERIVIRCNLGDDRIEVEVVDQGSGFDPGGVEVMPEPEDPADVIVDLLGWVGASFVGTTPSRVLE